MYIVLSITIILMVNNKSLNQSVLNNNPLTTPNSSSMSVFQLSSLFYFIMGIEVETVAASSLHLLVMVFI